MPVPWERAGTHSRLSAGTIFSPCHSPNMKAALLVCLLLAHAWATPATLQEQGEALLANYKATNCAFGGTDFSPLTLAAGATDYTYSSSDNHYTWYARGVPGHRKRHCRPRHAAYWSLCSVAHATECMASCVGLVCFLFIVSTRVGPV